MDFSLLAFEESDSLYGAADLIPALAEPPLDPLLHDHDFHKLLCDLGSATCTQQSLPGYSSGQWGYATPKHEHSISPFAAASVAPEEAGPQSNLASKAAHRKRKFKSASNLQELAAAPKRSATPKGKWDSDSSDESDQLLTQRSVAIPPSPSLQMQTTPVMKRSASTSARTSTLMPFDMFKVFGEMSNTKALGEVNRKIRAIADSEKRGTSMTFRTPRPSKTASVPTISVSRFSTKGMEEESYPSSL